MTNAVEPPVLPAARTRFLDSFRSQYQSFISVIQGALLAFVLVKVQPGSRPHSVAEWCLFAATVLVLVAVWEEYRIGAVAFMWVPRLADTLLPFAVGLSEAWLIGAFLAGNAREWFLAMAGFFVLGLLAYVHMYWRAGQEKVLNGELLRELRRWVWLNPIMCGACAAGFAWLALAVQPPEAGLSLVPAVGAVAVMVLFLLKGEWVWHRIVATQSKVPRSS